MKYIKPQTEILKFTSCDVITTSGPDDNNTGYNDNQTDSNLDF
ncbi:MAG: hypothetical protein Q4C99_06930 [Clostridia bacterium]|nr:hypothetical protein [Clostridia bacterium]